MIPRICLSVYGSTEEVLLAIAGNPEAFCYEIRLDLSGVLDLERVRSATSKPLIVASHQRPELLAAAAKHADYVDIGPASATDPKSIVSIHATKGDPEDLWNRYSGSHKTKIVIETEDYGAILKLLSLNRRHHGQAVCFAMGEAGSFSRILSGFEGAAWIYTSLPGRPTAAGQFDIRQLLDLFRIGRFASKPDVFGIVGNPVSHSRSPAFHNAAFAAESLNWIYVPLFCRNVAGLFSAAPDFGMRGFSVTHPHKAAVVPFLQEASREVLDLGACNTVCLKDGRWLGINTDVAGVEAWLKHAGVSSGSVVAILGAGSAARTVARVVRSRSRELHIVNRTFENAQRLATEFGATAHSLQDLPRIDCDVLIQTTPVGLREGECPVSPSFLKAGTTVLDAIYEPPETELLRKARGLGCRVFNGESWFLAQAEAQFRWWRRLSPQAGEP